MRLKHGFKHGFTLIELIVAFAGGMLVLVSLLDIFFLSRTALRKGGNLAEITQNGRIAIERLSRELRQAETLVSTLPESEQDAVSTISFQDGHNASALNYIRYYLSGGALHRELSYYYLDNAPSTHVPFGALNDDGSVAKQSVTEDEIIAEYITSLDFWGGQILNTAISLEEDTVAITTATAVFVRNLH